MLDATGNGYIPSMCEMCVWRCGLLAKVEDGRVVKLEGNPDHPHSNGKLCPRGQSGLMNTYDPDRVLTPLIRVGKRGEGQFRKASWEEALDLVAKNMLDIKQKYGPEAMIFSSTHNLSQVQFENLLNAFGSPNYGTQRSLCFNAMIVSNLMTYGMEEPGRHYDTLKYIILTGRNLMEAISTSETSDSEPGHRPGRQSGLPGPALHQDGRQGHRMAAHPPGHRPGLPPGHAQCHRRRRTVQLPVRLPRIRSVSMKLAGPIAQYTPEWAAAITGIPAETIRRIAREFAAAAPHALAHNGWRTSNFVNSFQTERAIAILNALVGNWNTAMFPAAGEESGVLGAPPQPPYPRVSAQRLDGVPWKYPFVPLKIGVFQELREAVLSGAALPGAWLVHRPPEPGHVPARPRPDPASLRKDGFHRHDRHHHERHLLVLGCGPAGGLLPGTLRSAQHRRRQEPSSASRSSNRRAKANRPCGFTRNSAPVWVWAITSSTRMKKIT